MHGENDFVASKKRFVKMASAKQNCSVTMSLVTATTVTVVTMQIVVGTVQIVVVTIQIVTTTIWFAEAILTKRLVEATKLFSPCAWEYDNNRSLRYSAKTFSRSRNLAACPHGIGGLPYTRISNRNTVESQIRQRTLI